MNSEMESAETENVSTETGLHIAHKQKMASTSSSGKDFDKLMNRIIYEAHTKRIRMESFFVDYDKFRTGLFTLFFFPWLRHVKGVYPSINFLLDSQ